MVVKTLEDLDNSSSGDNFELIIQEKESQRPPAEYTFCWRDKHRAKNLIIFARGGAGADNAHIHGYLTEREWLSLHPDLGLLMTLPTNKSFKWGFGLSFVPEDEDFALLYKAITKKAPTPEEIERFRTSMLYQNFLAD
ncbi:hypothetical protein FJZ17_02610 [Candidatus Pacearchaeota archaeon]|nr:hypothetical protein [Candidatus Pacearchaeota archaeon]